MKYLTQFFLSMAIVMSFFACQKQTTADLVMDRAIEKHGGWEAWQNTKHIKFDKTTVLYFPDGSIESKVTQRQSFTYHPNFSIAIHRENLGDSIHIVYDGKHVKKMINDSLITNNEEIGSAKRAALAAEYVIFLPFKLRDKSTILQYEGTTAFNGDEVHTLKVIDQNQKQDNDEWTFYFHKESYRLIGYQVKHKGRTSLIVPQSFSAETGLLLDTHRKSYFLDSLGQRKYLRAEFFYENFERTPR